MKKIMPFCGVLSLLFSSPLSLSLSLSVCVCVLCVCVSLSVSVSAGEFVSRITQKIVGKICHKFRVDRKTPIRRS